jgi:hypothetical protein
MVHSLFTWAAFQYPKVSTAIHHRLQRLPPSGSAYLTEQVDYSSDIGSFVRFCAFTRTCCQRRAAAKEHIYMSKVITEQF